MTAHRGQKACGGLSPRTSQPSQCITVKDSQAISRGHSYLESLPFDRRLPTGDLRITPLHCQHAPTTPLNPIGALNSLSSYGRAPAAAAATHNLNSRHADCSCTYPGPILSKCTRSAARSSLACCTRRSLHAYADVDKVVPLSPLPSSRDDLMMLLDVGLLAVVPVATAGDSYVPGPFAFGGLSSELRSWRLPLPRARKSSSR